MSVAFVCGPSAIGFDECWNCTGPTVAIKEELGAPLTGHDGHGRYCSVGCADEASERKHAANRRCTTCGGAEGRCVYTEPDDPPDDPHPYWPTDSDAPPELDAWLERNRALWELTSGSTDPR